MHPGGDAGRASLLLVVALALLTVLAPVAAAAYPHGPPDDPGYDPAEEGGPETCLHTSVTSEQYYLYDFMPKCARNAEDPEGASGMSVNAAWANYTTGNDETLIAYIEGGINWHDGSIEELVDKVWINTAELPRPQQADGTTATGYELTGDGTASASDYAEDPRVSDANGNDLIDPEDLIAAFSDGTDDDQNGFTDDISGWDFYNDQNDPATPDTAYDHANGQMEQAAAETNNGEGIAGVCPDCRVLPVKAGAEALDRTHELAYAWRYAAHVGADVIVSVTADLGYSSFMRETVHQLAHEGVVMVEASNDFDSTDHQGGMFWPHVLPGNGMVANTVGDPVPPSANERLETFRARSGYTSWGTHNVFTAATQGGTTSEATPTVGAVVAMVLAYGDEAAAQGLISSPLSGQEAIQVLRATASDVDDPTLSWPSDDGFDLQYGYGRPNVHAAMQAIEAGEIPPIAMIDEPRWYELVDPTRTDAVKVTGHIQAPRADSVAWTLEVAPGPDPDEDAFHEVSTGQSEHPEGATLGTVDLSQLPRSFWAKAHELSETKTLETNERYTVTLRLTVADGDGDTAIDRRAIAVHHDPTWLDGFPTRIGTDGPSGESQPALADLTGDGRLEIVFGDADGRVHALDAATGEPISEDWPVVTDPVTPDYPALRDAQERPREPILSPVSTGDVDGDGAPEVVATSLEGTVYAYDADGERLFARSTDALAITPEVPRQPHPYTRLPKAGATASPVLVDLDPDPALEVLQASWDGQLYALNGDGSAVDGWPVDVALPDDHTPPPGHFVVRDHKLVTVPAIADLDGDADPEIVTKSQFSDVVGAGVQPDARAHVFAYHHDGTPVDGWPVELPGLFSAYGTAQEFITEGSASPVAADVDADGEDEIALGLLFSPTHLVQGDGTYAPLYGVEPNPLASAVAGQGPTGWADGNHPTDAPVSFTTTGAFGRFAGTLTYAQPGSGGASIATSLLTPGMGNAIQNYERAYDAATGVPKANFPAEMQGLNFLGAPLFVDVTGDGSTEIVDGADSSTLHAWDATGQQATAFPKFTTGWTVFSPTAGDLDADGDVEVVTVTREGYVMAWETNGTADALEWPTYHHDMQRTGRYGGDTLDVPDAAPAPQGGSIWASLSGILGLAGVAVFQARGREP